MTARKEKLDSDADSLLVLFLMIIIKNFALTARLLSVCTMSSLTDDNLLTITVSFLVRFFMEKEKCVLSDFTILLL